MTRWLINISPWPRSSIPLQVRVTVPVSAPLLYCINSHICRVMGGEVIIKTFARLLLLSDSVWPIASCVSWTLKLSVRSLLLRRTENCCKFLDHFAALCCLPAILSLICGFAGQSYSGAEKLVLFKDASRNDLNKTKASSTQQKILSPCQRPHTLPGLQL